MLLVPQTAATTWRVLCASVCLLFPLVLSLTLCMCSGAVSLARSFQVSATSPKGRHGRFFFRSSFFSFDLLPCFQFFNFTLISLFHRMYMSCLSYPELAPPEAGSPDLDRLSGDERYIAGMILIAPSLSVLYRCSESGPHQLQQKESLLSHR